MGYFISMHKFLKQHALAVSMLIIHACSIAVIVNFLSVAPDAADHWVWSRILFNGYLEHPPMVAWILHYFDLLFADPVTSVKVLPILMCASTYFILYLAVVQLFSIRVALIFLVILLSSPYFFVFSLLYHITTPMMLFFAISIWLIAKMVSTELATSNAKQYNYLLYIGLFLGLAFLSKILIVFVYMALGLFFISNRKQHHYFAHWQTYAAPLVSLVVMIPYILWNIETEWMSFIYQFNRGISSSFNLDGPAWYLLGQFSFGILMVPVMLYLACKRSFWINCTGANSLAIFWLVLFIVPFVLFLYSSASGGHLDVQWLNMGYIGLFIMSADFLSRSMTKQRLYKLLAGALIINLVFVGLLISHALFRSFGGLIEAQDDGSQHLIAWEETASEISSLFKTNNLEVPAVIVTRKYNQGGALSLYMENHPWPYSINKAQRNQWLAQETLSTTANIAFICKPQRCYLDIDDARELMGKQLRLLGVVATKNPRSQEIIRTYNVYVPSL
jgi:dolichol-phosphate mannosyltransferase